MYSGGRGTWHDLATPNPIIIRLSIGIALEGEVGMHVPLVPPPPRFLHLCRDCHDCALGTKDGDSPD